MSETPPPVTVFVPGDTSARSVGADDVAAQLLEHLGDRVRVVRNGSRGLLWLEPLIEVATPEGRVGWGPVTPTSVRELIEGGLADADPHASRAAGHPLYLGVIDEHRWLREQRRVTFARVGVVDPASPEDFLAHGGLAGLRRALTMEPAQIVEEVATSGLRGRGGAGFPAGIKWRTALDQGGSPKYIACNADEGDSGTYADRMLIEGDPFTLIEGMVIAAWATGADEGYIYLRSEYPLGAAALQTAIDAARGQGWLGRDILGSGLDFDLYLRVGGGAYICGEETSMLESLEGKRGTIRPKPPIPAISGLFGAPTLIHNVLTLGSVPAIIAAADGGTGYAALGTGRSRGTQVFQLGGNIARGGIVELPFGVTLGELIVEYGGGTRSGRPIRAVQVGGPLGSYVPPDQLDLRTDYEAFAAAGAMVGHGGIVVFDDAVDMARMARFAMEFCARESCGKCTPCRIGSVRGAEVIDKIIADDDRQANLVLLEDLCETMTSGSLCAMGGLTPQPVLSALRYFPEDFRRPGAPPPDNQVPASDDRHPAPSA
jgi:formate dehydrogenase iron-sulfur subunit